MKNRNIAIIAAALLLIIAVPLITVMRVTGSHAAGADTPPAATAVSAIQTRSVTPIPIGFFTDNHHRSGFDPDNPKFSPIGYPAIEPAPSLAAMKGHVEARGWVYFDAADLPGDRFNDEVNAQIMDVNRAMVRSGYDYARSGEADCAACRTLRLPPFFEGGMTAEGETAPAIMIIFGVEAASPVNNGLRSVLGAYLFEPDGRYRDHTFVEYNFTRYATEDFAEDLGEITEALLP